MSRALRLTGEVLSVAAMAWVIWPVVLHLGEIRSNIAVGSVLGAVAWGGMAYAGLTILLAGAWWWLCGLGGRRPPPLAAYAVWARSQIAKYLPGNVFHYVSRQVMGRDLGLSPAVLISSGVLEMASAVTAAAAISVLAATAASTEGSPLHLALLLAVPPMALLGLPLAYALTRRMPAALRLVGPLPQLTVIGLLRLLLPAMILHVAFLLGTGVLLVGLLAGGWPQAPVEPLRVIPAYALAWLLGTLTPGAPGGAGVREAVITLQLGPLLGRPTAAALAVLLRLVTVGGDLIAALVGWKLRPRQEPGDRLL